MPSTTRGCDRELAAWPFFLGGGVAPAQYLYFQGSLAHSPQGSIRPGQAGSVPIHSSRKQKHRQKRQTILSGPACLLYLPSCPAWPARLCIFLSGHGTGHWITSAARGQRQRPARVFPVLKRTLVLPSLHPVSPTPSVFPSVADSLARPSPPQRLCLTTRVLRAPPRTQACQAPRLPASPFPTIAHFQIRPHFAGRLKAHYNSPTSPLPPGGNKTRFCFDFFKYPFAILSVS